MLSINTILLIAAALFPAVALCVYVFIKDRAEKEPLGLLLGLLAAGAFLCLPAIFFETVLGAVIQAFFSPFVTLVDGVPVAGTALARELYLLADNTIGIALVEEGLKFAVLYLITHNNKNFNSLFDGIVYAVFVSLGFAALENVLYVLSNGWTTAIMRCVLSVPGHMFFGVIMGYYYGMWHLYGSAARLERQYKVIGLLPPNAQEFSGALYLVLGLLIPTALHGLYDYCCSTDFAWSTAALFLLVGILYVYCFKKISRMSKMDTFEYRSALALVLQKHPHLYQYVAPGGSYNQNNF